MSESPRSPVLSLTVLDAATLVDGVLGDDSSVLIVARRPAANPTHPNVISVPTQRLPGSLHRDIVASATLLGEQEGVATFAGGEVDSGVDNGHLPLVFAVESLLTRKLGLSEALESGEVAYRAALRTSVRGTAVYDNFGPEDVYERIDMLNVVVALSPGRGPLPHVTSSYGPIGWTTVSNFIAGVDRRDPRRIDPALDAIELCVHGVCLAAARASLMLLLGERPFAEPRADAAPVLPGWNVS